MLANHKITVIKSVNQWWAFLAQLCKLISHVHLRSIIQLLSKQRRNNIAQGRAAKANVPCTKFFMNMNALWCHEKHFVY